MGLGLGRLRGGGGGGGGRGLVGGGGVRRGWGGGEEIDDRGVVKGSMFGSQLQSSHGR